MVSKTMPSINDQADQLPLYADLPLVDGTDLRHAWDVFGPADSLGTLHHLTPNRRLAAMTSSRTGETVCLTLPLNEPHTAPFGRDQLVHVRYRANRFSWGDRVERLDLQSSTQWDGLLHVSHTEAGFYGGHRGDPDGAPHLGIDAWARTGIVGRGVLLDVGAHLAARGGYDALERHVVTPAMLLDVAEAQAVELRPGDILCVRLGWYAAFSALDEDAGRQLMGRVAGAGLSATGDMAEFLWDRRIAAVACDNVTVEVQPGDRADGFLHHRLITMLGMPLGELFDFEELAGRCRDVQKWDFVFTSVPLHLPGGVGSPANAVAVL
ncbi:cyclase family protein [Aeromicrobium wangtongii]|uniref:cyclase family protein n=1 Tax=Aeromicrobium wangtongii TaxID=2969247 RepID=UPI002016B62D|nr:cyclase family protein [Aeromicrobium wangtongii]MCL3819854.1 cyclase family protein [Aeromicrobium wangtongii]